MWSLWGNSGGGPDLSATVSFYCEHQACLQRTQYRVVIEHLTTAGMSDTVYGQRPAVSAASTTDMEWFPFYDVLEMLPGDDAGLG